jgi:hypothetical protein
LALFGWICHLAQTHHTRFTIRYFAFKAPFNLMTASMLHVTNRVTPGSDETTLIEGVLSQLSAERYPGLYKTLWFEVGEAHRAVLENKISAKRPPLSLSGAARASAEVGRCTLTPPDHS